jgi:hypothetical protein
VLLLPHSEVDAVDDDNEDLGVWIVQESGGYLPIQGCDLLYPLPQRLCRNCGTKILHNGDLLRVL